VFINEVAESYAATEDGRAPRLTELEVQYADYAHWQRRHVSGGLLERQLDYWREQLAGAPSVLELPADRPRPAMQRHHGATARFEIDGEMLAGLRAYGRAHGATLHMTLLSAFVTLLARYTSGDDIVVGTPVAGRTRRETEGLIGCFVNNLVVRVDASGDPSFDELVGRVRAVALAAYAHQDLPFEQLVDALHPHRSLAYTPLFQVMFVLQNTPAGELALPGLALEPLAAPSVSTRFDLTLSLTEHPDRLEGAIEYSTDLFDSETIARWSEHFRRLLAAVMSDSSRTLSRLDVMGGAERRQVLVEWNDTTVAYPSELQLHGLFEAQARRTPAAIAVVHGAERLDYATLNARANRLAHRLRTLGVGPEVLVGVCVERSAEMVVALLAVLKAGGAYVPFDPSYPRERLAFMRDDSRIAVLITQTCLTGADEAVSPRAESGARIAMVHLDTESVASELDTDPGIMVSPDNLAYVLYTSGSTGKPKGVALQHRNAVALVNWSLGEFTAEHLAGTLASTSLNFDLSVFEIFAPLGCGGTVVVVRDAFELIGRTGGWPVTLVNMVPSTVPELLRAHAVPESARTITLCGEPLAGHVVQSLYDLGHVDCVYNLYGPSEDTTYSTVSRQPSIQPGTPTIGRPISNTRAYVLDQHMAPTPVGVVGELFLAGDGLARGYIERPAISAERFVPDPFARSPGERLYRTGDLARFGADGELEFQGRSDHQVKLRGFRIELGEIEAVLFEQPEIRRAAVIVREDRPEDRRLVAYVVMADASVGTVQRLRDALATVLPEYMIPAAFVPLEALPLMPNGKIDRRALPVPEYEGLAASTEFVAARSQEEALVVSVWTELLGIERISVHANFFEIGGHSLLAVRAHSALAERVDSPLTIVDLFRYPTVRTLAERIAGGAPAAGARVAALERAGKRRGAFERARRPRRSGRHSNG